MNLETLTITEDILFIIAELDEFKGAWRALGRLAPERLSALRHVATIESICCNEWKQEYGQKTFTKTGCGRVLAKAGERQSNLVYPCLNIWG